MRRWIGLLTLCALGACDGKVQVDPDMNIATGTEANIEHPTYDTDTLRWVREGRVVEFQGERWVAIGSPIDAPLVKEVGEFEGMKLYTSSEQTPPFDRLLIPTQRGWQILQPAQGGVGADTAANDTGARASGNARPVDVVPDTTQR